MDFVTNNKNYRAAKSYSVKPYDKPSLIPVNFSLDLVKCEFDLKYDCVRSKIRRSKITGQKYPVFLVVFILLMQDMYIVGVN